MTNAIQPYRTVEVTLEGYAQGPIWQPGFLCEKRFAVSVGKGPFQREFTTMRDLLLHVTNDGDFQWLSVTRCWFTVKRQRPDRVLAGCVSTHSRRIEWTVDNAPPALADLFAEEVSLDWEGDE